MHNNCQRCKEPFTPRRGNQRYCGPACSAYVRNRRYYATIRGRRLKRAANSRYFQRNPQRQYDAKRRRLDILAVKFFDEHVAERRWLDNEMKDRRCGTCLEMMAASHGKLDAAARSMAREQIDYHPNAFDGPKGQWRWVPNQDGTRLQLRNMYVRDQVFEMGRDGKLFQVPIAPPWGTRHVQPSYQLR